jgi:predicted DNA-binding protein (UPF0251 family)
MPRPPKPRAVAHPPASEYFKPRGIPMTDLEERVLALDELEAIRLVDLEAMSQEEAGAAMGVSRGTIGRLLERGRRTVADALLHGHALRIEGGPVVARRVPKGRCCLLGPTGAGHDR